MMKCNGYSDFCGARCPECSRFMDDCEGNPNWEWNDNEEWVEVEEEEKPC